MAEQAASQQKAVLRAEGDDKKSKSHSVGRFHNFFCYLERES